MTRSVLFKIEPRRKVFLSKCKVTFLHSRRLVLFLSINSLTLPMEMQFSYCSILSAFLSVMSRFRVSVLIELPPFQSSVFCGIMPRSSDVQKEHFIHFAFCLAYASIPNMKPPCSPEMPVVFLQNIHVILRETEFFLAATMRNSYPASSFQFLHVSSSPSCPFYGPLSSLLFSTLSMLDIHRLSLLHSLVYFDHFKLMSCN